MIKWRLLLISGLAIILFSSTLCFSEPPNPRRWVPLSHHYYYNKTMITKAPDILLVWTYKTVTDDFRLGRIEELKTYDPEKSIKYSDFHHETVLWEIDCKQRRIRLEEMIDFDSQGQILDRYRYDNTGWQPIYPKTGGDTLYSKVCFPQSDPSKKKKRGKSINNSKL